MHSSVNYNKLSFVISIIWEKIFPSSDKKNIIINYPVNIYIKEGYIYERKEENQEISSKILFI